MPNYNGKRENTLFNRMWKTTQEGTNDRRHVIRARSILLCLDKLCPINNASNRWNHDCKKKQPFFHTYFISTWIVSLAPYCLPSRISLLPKSKWCNSSLIRSRVTIQFWNHFFMSYSCNFGLNLSQVGESDATQAGPIEDDTLNEGRTRYMYKGIPCSSPDNEVKFCNQNEKIIASWGCWEERENFVL